MDIQTLMVRKVTKSMGVAGVVMLLIAALSLGASLWFVDPLFFSWHSRPIPGRPDAARAEGSTRNDNADRNQEWWKATAANGEQVWRVADCPH